MTRRQPNDDSTSDTSTIHARDVLTFLRRGLLLALLVAVVSGGTAYLLARAAEPVYRASIVLVASQPGSGLGNLDVVTPPQIDPGVYRTALMEGTILSDALLRVTGRSPSESELRSLQRSIRVTVEDQRVSSMIRIDLDHTDPVYATEVANTIAEELIIWDRERARRILARGTSAISRTIREIDVELGGTVDPTRQAELLALRDQRVEELELAARISTSALVVGLLEPLRFASPPEQPVGPRVVFQTFVATVLGVVLGYAFLLVLSALDTRIGNRDEVIALTGLPVLAEFARRSRRASRLSGETASFLRTNLEFATRSHEPRIFVISSTSDAAEKDGVAVSLAESFARSGNRTLLIDADLRHPATTAWLDVIPSHAAPLEVYLANPHRRYLPVTVSVGSNRTFDFIPSFTSTRFPVDIINEGLPGQVDAWRAEYDVIVLDSTPVVPYADTLAIAPYATGVVLCASARRTPRERLDEAVRLLRQAQVNTLGLVITELPNSRARRKLAKEELNVLQRLATDPYKTQVPNTRNPVDA